MIQRLIDHINRHPVRLLVTLLVPLILSASLAIYAIWRTVENNQSRDVAICKQVNDLRTDMYILSVDLTTSLLNPQDASLIREIIRGRLHPYSDCEPPS